MNIDISTIIGVAFIVFLIGDLIRMEIDWQKRIKGMSKKEIDDLISADYK